MMRISSFHIFVLSGLILFLPSLSPAVTPNDIVCVKCHEAQTGRLAKPVELWRKSIHAENRIACNDCHGGDPKDAANAMNPDRGFLGKPKPNDIPGFCGRCHVGVMKDYLASLHGKTLGRGGPTCVTCHGNHLVVKATIELINEKDCTRCHDFEKSLRIKEAMRETESKIVYLDGKLTDFKGKGVDTSQMEKTMFAARNRFHTLFHELDVIKIKEQTAGISKDLDVQLQHINELAETDRKRKIAGFAAIAAALLAALLLRLYAKTLD